MPGASHTVPIPVFVTLSTCLVFHINRILSTRCLECGILIAEITASIKNNGFWTQTVIE